MDGDIRVTFETDQKYELQLGADYTVSCASSAFSVVSYEPWHLRALALQPHQEHLGAYLRKTPKFADQVTASGACWSALSAGQPIACGGFIDHWVGRASVWAALSDHAGHHMLALTRAVRRGIAEHPAERIEATVVAGFEPGIRWVLMLGFEDEGLLRRYQYGHDHRAFVILKARG